jgi:cell division protein FtsN
MQVEKLIASLLQKHGHVFIPTLGELTVNKENTKLEGSQMIPGNSSLSLNPFSDNNDGLLFHAFSKEIDASIEDAQGDFSKAIHVLKSNLDSGTSIDIPGYGLLTKKGKSIGFQEEKNNFLPNDFFGLNNLNVQNPNTNLNLNQFVSVPVEASVILNKKDIDQKIESIEEPLTEIPSISEIEVAQEAEPTMPIFEEEVQAEIQDTPKNEVFAASPQPEKTFEQEYIASPRHQQTSKKSNLKWSTVAGLVSLFLIASFLTAWVYATLKCNKMMGLNPLWDHGCQKTPLAEANSVDVTTKDSSTASKSVSAENAPVLAAQKPVGASSHIAEVPAKVEKEAPKEVVKPAPPVITAPPVVKTPSKPTAKVEKPVAEKPKEAKQIEKPAAKAIEKPITKVEKEAPKEVVKPKTKESVKVNPTDKPKEVAKVVEKPKTDKITTEKPKVEKPVVDKPKVVKETKVAVKPMPKVPMSAAYRKGMAYLCFGTFKNPTVAKKLRADMKNIGVITETIEIDGTYRVVIPYTNRKFAAAAAEDYPNTIIFE